MPKPRPYYTLAVRQEGRWAPQFGDYQRERVEQEARDAYRVDHHGKAIKANDRKIVRTDPDCDAIDAAIRALNKYDPALPFAIGQLLFGRA
jgi:hypothetical protein